MPFDVAVLCCARKSVYKSVPGVECFDIDRDARTFDGGMPVVAHPPCRLWSAFCAHQAKSNNPDAERALGVFCVEQVRAWGGIVEQPAHSRLWDECRLPRPIDCLYAAPETMDPRDGYSFEISQYWFGDSREKATWLWFSGLDKYAIPTLPFRLKAEGGDRRTWQLMSRNTRERTPIAFAEWMVSCARLAKVMEAQL